MYYTRFDAPFCEIILAGDEEGLSNLHLNTGEGKRRFEVSPEWIRKDAFFSDTIHQINEYFSGRMRTQFNVALNPEGTDFQKRVWRKLADIGYGTLCTYKEIARAVGNENASRAVGMANSKNPIPLIVPCHRVVGTNGQLTGFAHGVAIKKRLIDFEREQNMLSVCTREI